MSLSEQQILHTTTHAARDAVLNTAELFEHILASSNAKTLFVVQRVSKHWQKVIQESVTLQRVMFFRPTSGPHTMWHLQGLTNEVPNNGSMWAADEPVGSIWGFQNADTPPTADHILKTFTPTLANPLLTNVSIYALDHRPGWEVAATCNLEHLQNSKLSVRMYLTDPPCKKVVVSNANGAVQHTVRFESGVKFFDVFDTLDGKYPWRPFVWIDFLDGVLLVTDEEMKLMEIKSDTSDSDDLKWP